MNLIMYVFKSSTYPLVSLAVDVRFYNCLLYVQCLYFQMTSELLLQMFSLPLLAFTSCLKNTYRHTTLPQSTKSPQIILLF